MGKVRFQKARMMSQTREVSTDRRGKVKEPVPYLSDSDLKAHM